MPCLQYFSCPSCSFRLRSGKAQLRERVFCVGLVTDIGKINDRSFNQSAWKGVQQAQQELGALVQYIETAYPGFVQEYHYVCR